MTSPKATARPRRCACGCGNYANPPRHFIDGHRITKPPIPPLEVRFWERVKKTDLCWLWTGSTLVPDGYGRIKEAGRWLRAHRVAYELLVGPIPDGLVLDHLCRNPRCVNPDHLEVVTSRENTLRGVSHQARNARKTHCKRGHEFTPENTGKAGESGRYCRTCKRDYDLSRFPTRCKKLTREQVLEIRSSDEPLAVLAERYGIHRSYVGVLRWRGCPSWADAWPEGRP